MPKKKLLSNEDFLRRVRDYLPMDAAIWNTDEHGKPCSCAIASGMEENHFYLFDAEAILSASHAIEELALEEANGTLLATMQEFKNFEPHRDRYWQLAATLHQVHVIARRKKPARHGHLKFTAAESKVLSAFWTLLYQGKHCQALLLCRQAHAAKHLEQKNFIGFYTFNPKVIVRVKQNIEDVLAGRASKLWEFERLLAIDQAAKQIRVQFDREHKAVEEALRKLQTAAEHYRPRQFATDLEKSLHRLRRLSDRLPHLVATADFRTAA